jgi:hypothetical protein
MKKFSELGVKPMDDKHIFNVPVISIEDLINCEIEVLDFEANITTRHGDGRYIVKIKNNGIEQKFFTNASPIKEALDQIAKEDFPFMAMIKQHRYGGSKKTYQFN